MREFFRKLSSRVSLTVGSPWTFFVALGCVLVWALTGPLFEFSDTWQLVINTGTTIVTFLVVFLIQNTQNRDAKAIQLKLDELIRAIGAARDELVDLEELPDDELARLQTEFHQLRERHAFRADAVAEEVGRRKRTGAEGGMT
jgi:low affinity Fe/Cu permease